MNVELGSPSCWTQRVGNVDVVAVALKYKPEWPVIVGVTKNFMILPHAAIALVTERAVRMSPVDDGKLFRSALPVLVSDDQLGSELGVVKYISLHHLL